MHAPFTLVLALLVAPARADDFDVVARSVVEDVPVSTREEVKDTPGWSTSVTGAVTGPVLRVALTEQKTCTRQTIDTVDRTNRTVRTVENPKALRTSWTIGIAGAGLGGALLGATFATPGGLWNDKESPTYGVDLGMAAAGALGLVVGGRALLGSAAVSSKLHDEADHVGHVEVLRAEVPEKCGDRVPTGSTVTLLGSNRRPASADALTDLVAGTLDDTGAWTLDLTALSDADVARVSKTSLVAVRVDDSDGSRIAWFPDQKDPGLGPALAAERKRRRVASLPAALEPCFKLYEQGVTGTSVSARDAMLNPYATAGKVAIWNLDAFERGVGLDATTNVFTLSGCMGQFNDLRCEAAVTLSAELAARTPNDRRLVGTLAVYRGMTLIGAKDIPRLEASCWVSDVAW